MSDKEIIQGFLEGATKQYNVIVHWITEVVHAKLWIGDCPGNDIVSETTMKLLINFRANRFKFESSLKTYVQRIARYTIVDYVRSSRRAKEFSAEQSLYVSHNPNPHELYETEEEVLLFNVIIARINEECRKIWSMMFFEKLSYKEIARNLDIKEGTLKTKVYRCKEAAISVGKKII